MINKIITLPLILTLLGFTTATAEEVRIPESLEFHYLCNEVIERGVNLSQSQLYSCSQHYLTLKASFLTVTEQEWANADDNARVEMLNQAYLNFKAWEEANPVLVESLEEATRQIVDEMIR